MKASWNDIIRLYELYVGDSTTKMCYKLTNQHVYAEKIKKMKVKYAAQIFSHRVSSTLRWTAIFGKDNLFGPTVLGTAEFLSFMDQLFDSVNGSTLTADHGKELRCAVNNDSPHVAFWMKAIKILKSVKFITVQGEKTPPSILNWIKTLLGFIYIWHKLKNNGFHHVHPRNFNQDPLENFFGCIRSHGVRNVNPTCASFISSFKTLIINNFTSPHSPGANCESDENTVLNSLQLFLQDNVEQSNVQYNEESNLPPFTCNTVEDYAIINTHSYISGYIASIVQNVITN